MTARTHRVLVVGGGSIGERHVRCFQATGRAYVALCEIDADRRREVAASYALEETFGDYPAALASGPELVVVATPAHLHLEMATAAARAGAHLLIEKPLATSCQGVSALMEAVACTGAIAGVAYVYRCHPALAAMRAAIQAGRFGTPLEVVAVCGQPFHLYRPAYRTIYYNRRETGGGAVQDALTHEIDIGQWLVGPIDRLVADVDHLQLDGVEVEDTVHVLARHGRVMGCYTLNQHQAPNETTITVIGSGGTARFEYHRSRWRWMTEPGGQWHDEDCGPLERDTLFVRQAAAMLDAIEHRQSPPCTLAEGLAALRVNLAILRSAERGGWETLPAASNTHD